ncbi:methyltransferase domain-containing protein [Pseudomonas aeruginosa]|uniref:methyltransferase domain-containing protein n=1 Tax=Pseudomonas putida TaxID=303 RepID=UPI001623C6FE|nr:methyltransferase domain-containing protein [Pseudomonas putida]EKT4504266.1 methyltransferase domain-containing protein [Pseudomonas putida]QNG08285.1 methyltransferase domain-containing protein [Pseudomonas putida]HDS1059466.1 methyltransferase domain-containing protein [Pseudomonas putida]
MSTIESRVADLPELYQPIFGHPELSEGSSRTSHDRLVHITSIYKVVEKIQERPLKVLDLGCAQGFFSLNLAALGASVHGIDYLEQNVEVCRTLLAEHPEFKAQFTFGKVEEFLESVEPGQYDLVLGLSVFHHLVYDLGKERIKAVIEQLLHKITVFIGEFALAEEPLYWGPAQPQDPRYLIGNSAFLHELSRHPTHLADIQRPLYVASNQIWYLDGIGQRILSWTPDSHALADGAHQGARRYYISDDYFVKVFRIDGMFGPRNQKELAQEAEFLRHPPAGFDTPRHFTSGGNDAESWLVTERIEGELLLDVIARAEPLDKRAVLLDVLRQLAALEQQGFYHDDVRVWNVMLDSGRKARLIDFGSIGNQPEDCVWPHNLYLSFMIFVKEVVTGVVDKPTPLREIAISPFNLPQPYADWMNGLWTQPVSAWSFQLLLDSLEAATAGGGEPVQETSTVLWMSSIESALQAIKKHLHHVESEEIATRSAIDARLKALDEKGDRMALIYERHLAELERDRSELTAQLNDYTQANRTLEEQLRSFQASSDHWHQRAIENEARAATSEARASNSEQRASNSEQRVQALLSSTSWFMTKPMRVAVVQGSRVTRQLLAAGKATVRKSLVVAIRKAAARPEAKRQIVKLLNHYPSLAARLRQFARNQGLTVAASRPAGSAMPGMAQAMPGDDALSSRAHDVLQKFKKAIKTKDVH